MQKIILGIDITPLLKAHKKFEQFRQHLNSEQEQAGAIQAFEFTYELAWKTMKRLLATKGTTTNSPRDTFREAALVGFIDDPELWFDFIDIRNESLCAYDQAKQALIISHFEAFSSAVKDFLHKI